MAYILTPYSLVTGAFIDASEWNQNFIAYQNGLAAGTKAIHVGDVGVDAHDATEMETVNRNITGDATGQREIIVLYRNGYTTLKQGQAGYLQADLFPFYTTENAGFIAMRDGWLVGASLTLQCDALVTATCDLTAVIRKNAVAFLTIGTASVTVAGTADTITVKETTKANAFSAGDRFSVYATTPAGALNQADSVSLTIFMEVIVAS